MNDVAIDSVNYSLRAAIEVTWERAGTVVIAANETERESRPGQNNVVVDIETPVSGTDYTVDSGAVTVTLEDTLARGTTLVLAAGAAGATLSALQLRARHLFVAGTEQSLNDLTDADTAASIAVYGRKEWQGRPYGGLSTLSADSLSQAIPQAYRDGIAAQRCRVFVGQQDEATAEGIADLAAVSLEVGGDDFEGRAREISHDWQAGLHFVDVVVDQDGGLLASGINPFILGSSTLDGPDVLWI